MPAERREGMDHEHHEWSPISTRGKLSWPNNARVALCVIITLEHTEWEAPEGSFSAKPAAWGCVLSPTTHVSPTGNTATGWASSGCWTRCSG